MIQMVSIYLSTNRTSYMLTQSSLRRQHISILTAIYGTEAGELSVCWCMSCSRPSKTSCLLTILYYRTSSFLVPTPLYRSLEFQQEVGRDFETCLKVSNFDSEVSEVRPQQGDSREWRSAHGSYRKTNEESWKDSEQSYVWSWSCLVLGNRKCWAEGISELLLFFRSIGIPVHRIRIHTWELGQLVFKLLRKPQAIGKSSCYRWVGRPSTGFLG